MSFSDKLFKKLGPRKLFRALVIAVTMATAGYAAGASPAQGWDERGHRIVAEKAMRGLPRNHGLPEFLFEPQTVRLITQLSMKSDLMRSAGKRDLFYDNSHHILLDDDGTAGGADAFSLESQSFEGWQRALSRVGKSMYAVGYLPLAIRDGYEQLVRDFAYWRVMNAVIESADMPEAKKEAAREARDMWRGVIINDLGTLTHPMGDAAVPLHTSIHIGSWNGASNPNGYTTKKDIHYKFEGQAVEQLITPEDVDPHLEPYRAVIVPIQARVKNYILNSHRLVEALYDLEQRGAFDADGPEEAVIDGRDFIARRLAAGANELRDLVAQAWQESAKSFMGYYDPFIQVTDLVRDPARVTPAMLGLPPDGFRPHAHQPGRLALSRPPKRVFGPR